MIRLVDIYIKVMNKITTVLGWIMQVVLAFMICVVFTQVLSRYLHFSASYLEELARYCNIYLAFLAMAYCMGKDSMVKVDTVQMITKGWLHAAIVAAAEIVSLITCIFFVVSGIRLCVLGVKSTSPTMGFTMTAVYLIIPVCCALAILNRIAFLLKKKRGDEKK